MKSWVRYSVAVYMGLMLAGAMGTDRPQESGAAPFYSPGHLSPYPHEMHPHTWRKRSVEVREEVRVEPVRKWDLRTPRWPE